jgi:hypothetical protein
MTLCEFVALHREELIARCQAKVAMRSVPSPTPVGIEHGVPLFLDQLVDALRSGCSSSPEIKRSAVLHGHDLLLQGVTVSQVVHDYGDVCQSVTDLAVELKAPISAEDFRTLNYCLDDAIAGAVTEYGRERNQSSVDGETIRWIERVGFYSHELRNLIHTGLLALEVLKSGKVGVAGSTVNVLDRSLTGARDLIARSLAEVGLTKGLQSAEPFSVSVFLEELAPAAMLAANAADITLTVLPLKRDVLVTANRQVVTAVVMNLLQNALKFTQPRTTVTLRAGASVDRVLIDIQDECGGLPNGDTDGLFRPFEQRGANRTGLGLGLAFSRQAIEANLGRVYARNLPAHGCVFTIDLPRFSGHSAHVPSSAAQSRV